MLQERFVIPRQDRNIAGDGNAATLQVGHHGQHMDGPRHENRGRSVIGSQLTVEERAEIRGAAIVPDDAEPGVEARPVFESFAQPRFAVRFAAGRSFGQAEDDVSMSFCAKEPSGMAAGRTIIEIDRGQGDAGGTGSRDEAGELPFEKPALHRFARAVGDPGRGGCSRNESLETAVGIVGKRGGVHDEFEFEARPGEGGPQFIDHYGRRGRHREERTG